MKVLIMNCSPVRNGATAEIVNIVLLVWKRNMMLKTYVLMIMI